MPVRSADMNNSSPILFFPLNPPVFSKVCKSIFRQGICNSKHTAIGAGHIVHSVTPDIKCGR